MLNNSTKNISESVTPKYDITWYVKWISSILVLIAIVVRSASIASLVWLDLTLCLLGSIGWAFVAFKWNDRALLIMNAVICVIISTGLLRLIYEGMIT